MNWQSEHPDSLPIAEVCRRTGLTARTVRYYEELGLLPGVRRWNSGRRAYGADELERLRFIQRLKALGLSLAEIKDLNLIYAIEESTEVMLASLAELLGRRLSELDSRIGELTVLRQEMAQYRLHVESRSDPKRPSPETPR